MWAIIDVNKAQNSPNGSNLTFAAGCFWELVPTCNKCSVSGLYSKHIIRMNGNSPCCLWPKLIAWLNRSDRWLRPASCVPKLCSAAAWWSAPPRKSAKFHCQNHIVRCNMIGSPSSAFSLSLLVATRNVSETSLRGFRVPDFFGSVRLYACYDIMRFAI